MNEIEGEASITVKNAGACAALLHVTIEAIPEDKEDALVILTPAITRIEAGETQLIRLVPRQAPHINSQRLRVINFQELRQRSCPKNGESTASTTRQQLPLIVHPRGLKRHFEPWKLLNWRVEGGRFSVSNDSAYVVRLAQEIVLQPSGKHLSLPRTYILPGEKISIAETNVADSKAVHIVASTIRGNAGEHYIAPITSVPVDLSTRLSSRSH
ncbi:hypothetical protein A7J71_20590 [Achromobacter insolitus]|nr:hypothetical protein A7J71_20590 [Achromobacter insolitus]OCZ53097.1 hypothetical protein A7P22_16260 [Achromobacter insolitus]